ncbi:MAG: DUF456 domain-containing protein [Actinomycetia bacterium]|nr:DUF456 domain-containing protein [Actinomycetes bacterium]
MSDVEMTILVAVVMVVGLFGTVVPVLPGLALIWAAALVYGLVVGFGALGVGIMVMLSALVVVAVVKAIWVPKRMADGHDVSRWSQVAALVGAVVGFFVIPVVGVIVGALVGLLLAEYLNQGDWKQAWGATVAVAKGFGLSTLIDIGLAMAMIGLWSIWALAVVT